MPCYSFSCEKCSYNWDEICRFSAKDSVLCPKCKKKPQVNFGEPNLVFSNPKDTSKWDNFSYRAGFNMETAKAERRAAEAATGQKNPYATIDDSNLPGVFREEGVSV